MISAPKGFERFYTPLRFFFQATSRILFVLIILHITLTCLLIKPLEKKYFGGEKGICTIITYCKSYIVSAISFGNRSIFNPCDNTGEVNFEFMNNNYSQFINRCKGNFLALFTNTCWIYSLYPFLLLAFSYVDKRATRDKVVRGGDLIEARKLNKYINSDSIKFHGYRFKITENISIPESIVTRHNFIIGKPGSGKSQLLYRIIEQVLANNYKCIIHDSKGDMISAFYDPEKHLIFNPLDKRHVKWDLFSELNSTIDIDSFVASLIPESASNDNFFPISARQLLGSTIIYCIKNNFTTYSYFWNLLNKSNEELLELFRTTDGCEEGIKLLTEGKTANNIMAVLSNYVKPFKYLIGTRGNFSIKNWVKDDDPDKKVIFLSNYAMIQDTIRPFLALFVDFATRSLCSLPDSMNRRQYFMLDEFGQLGKIGSIKQLLTQSRSKGGSVFLASQDVGQINAIYGKDTCISIVNSCGNTISFSVSDSDTAEFISKKIGSIEIKRTNESISMGVTDLRDSISQSNQIIEKRIVLPSEIMNLETLNLYAKLTDLIVTKDSFEYKNYPSTQNKFVERNDFRID